MSVQGSVRLSLVAAVGLTVALSGCVATLNDLKDNVTGRLGAEEPPRPDEAFAWEDFVGPQYSQEYAFPVDEGARAVTASVALTMRSSLPGESPLNLAQVTVFLQDANGEAVSENVTLDPQNPTASLEASSINATGSWALVASGMGLAGNEQGAVFNASVLVGYGGEPSGSVK